MTGYWIKYVNHMVTTCYLTRKAKAIHLIL
jgi:hypothetical protein